MKIVPFEKASFEDNEVYFDDIAMKYMQNPDCSEDSDGPCQVLELSSRNNGTARFINIKTDSWSIDDPMDLVKIVNDFCKRAGIELEED